ncbi:MAG: acyltransferase [Clostridia bacterium]|nr:acyltransferase [Clostridia bacterium]
MKALSKNMFRLRKIFHKCLPRTGALGRMVELTIKKTSHTQLGNNLRIASFGTLRVYGNATLHIGENFQSNNGLMLICRNQVKIGRDVTIGPNVCIVDFNHDFNHENLRDNFIMGSVEIGDNVWIGASVIIFPNSVIGNNCVIGAGSIVTGTIQDGTIYFNQIQKVQKNKS